MGGLPEPRGIVSNMPYNITGPLLGKVEEVGGVIDRAVLMMQKEVASKITAKAGDRTRGALSVVLQRAFEISLVCQASAGCFLPPPKVDSTVLLFVPRGDRLEGQERERFAGLVRMGFAHPRKTLANNLKGRVDVVAAGLRATVRPHELTEEDWERLVAYDAQ